METITATAEEQAQEVLALIPERFREEFGVKLETYNYKGHTIHSLMINKCSLTFGNADKLSVSVGDSSVGIKNEDGVYLNLYIFGTGNTFYNIMAI